MKPILSLSFLLLTSVFVLSACSPTSCDEILEDYQQDKQDVSDNKGDVNDYHKLTQEYNKKFKDNECRGYATR